MEPTPSSDPDPAERFADLATLVERLRPRLRALFARHSVPPQDAEDVLQEVLIAALLRWETIRHRESWLLGAVRLKCALYWRRRRNDRVQAVESEMLEDLSQPLSPRQEHDEMRWDLEHLTSGLEPRHRKALWLRFAEGWSSREVAACLGYSPTSIRKLTYRCLEKVQRRALAEGLTLRI